MALWQKWIFVRVPFHRKFVIGLFDFIFSGPSRNVQCGIVVGMHFCLSFFLWVCGRCQSSCPSLSNHVQWDQFVIFAGVFLLKKKRSKSRFWKSQRFSSWGGLVGWSGIWCSFRHVCYVKKIAVPLGYWVFSFVVLLLNKTRTVKLLRHSWRLSFTQDGLGFSTKTARRTLQVQLREALSISWRAGSAFKVSKPGRPH